MSEEVAKDVFTHALIIELDYVVVNIREIEFESIKRGIQSKGIDLTHSMFSRSSMSPDHRSAITDILKTAGNKADAIEKAVSEVDKSVADYCINHAEINHGVLELIKAAQSRNVLVKVYSALDTVLAQGLIDRIGLSEMNVELMIPDEIRTSFPKADDWLKMLKKYELEDKTIVAVVSSQLACKGALTAGASCIALPDKYTSFQDYSGAKFILDRLDKEKPDYLLDHTLRV